MDRLIRGFLAGMGGALVMNTFDLLVYYGLNIVETRFLDWAGVLLFGHLPASHLEAVYALLIQIVWSGFLGILLAYVFKDTTSNYYLLKGVIFALVSGFILYAIPVLFNIQPLASSTLTTVITNHMGGALWGLSAAWFLKRLDARTVDI